MPSTPMSPQKVEGPPVPACPKCQQVFVRRVLPKKGLEHLLWHLYLYPFRCQLCAHRFIAFQLGQRYTIQLDDMREYERLRVKLPVSFSGGSVKGSGATVDMTMKGCWIDTPQRVMVTKGMTLQLKIQEPGKGLPIEIESGMVRWALGRGFGVEFLSIKPNQMDRLRALVKSSWEKRRRDEGQNEPPKVVSIKKKVRAGART
jgi:hypothetical protein